MNARLLTALLAALGTTPVAAAEPSWRLPAAERAAVEALGRTLVEAINAERDSTRLRLIGQAYAPATVAEVGAARIASQLTRIHEQFPGLAFRRAELAEGLRGEQVWRVLHVYARPPGAPMWRDIQVRVSETPPYRLTQVAFIAEVTEPVYLPNGDLTDAATLEWLNGYLDRLVLDNQLSGAALVAIGGRVVFDRAFGFEDAARSRPVTVATHFNLASASKMFTALAVARLVADGRLSYRQTNERFFPDYPDRAHVGRVTIGHLLSHTSGIGEYWTDRTDDSLRSVRSTADVYRYVRSAGVRFASGARFEYSNSNFILAGLIVERVSGRPFEAYVKQMLTGPLAMSETGPFAADDRSRPMAGALARADTGWRAIPPRGLGTAAGGWWSTPHDMLRFMRGLAGGTIVPKAALDTMLVSRTRGLAGSPMDYGYGFILQRSGGVDSFGHGGTASGVNAEVRCFPARDAVLVVFSNQDNGAYDDLRRNLTRLITGER